MGNDPDDDFMVDPSYNAQGDDALEFDPGYESGRRGRGRPKGTKNKAGHRAGRPRKSAGEESHDEDESPRRKRVRTRTPRQPDVANIAPHPLHLPSTHGAPTNQAQNDSLHGLHGDIPVDPALIGGNTSSLVHAITNLRAEDQEFGNNYQSGSNSVHPNEPVYFHELPALPVATPKASTSKQKVDQVRNHVTEIGNQAGLAGMIRLLLPKDEQDQLPKISGPFQIITADDGRKRLDGPLSSSVVEQHSAPIYIYVANYRSGHTEVKTGLDDPLPTGPMPLSAWKITHPLTSEGKDRVRGPRRCGHCGKMECRGRGGRTWCPEYIQGQEGKLGKVKGTGRSPSIGVKEDSGISSADAVVNAIQRSADYAVLGAFEQHDHTENGDLSTGVDDAAKLADRAVMQHLIQNIHDLVPQDGSGEGHRHLFGDGFSANYASVVNNNAYAELHQHQQEQQENGGDEGEEGDIFSTGNEVDSLLQLQQHQLLQQESPEQPLASLPSHPLIGEGSNGEFGEDEEEDELMDHNIDTSITIDPSLGSSTSTGGGGGSARKSTRAPRRCGICKKGDCPGKTQRNRCTAAAQE